MLQVFQYTGSFQFNYIKYNQEQHSGKTTTIPKTGHILIGKISKQLHSVSVFLEVGLYIFNQE